MPWKYFTLNEFDDPSVKGSGCNMDLEFINLLELIRGECNFPFKITSGFRTKEHNEKVGGVSGSAHTDGVAADIAVSNSQQKFKLITTAINHGVRRVGVGNTFVHLDISRHLPQDVLWTY